MKDIGNKERILKIKEIFERETDEDNELSFEDLIRRLKLEYGSDYQVGLRAIKDDINTLNNFGYDLVENENKFGKKFYSRQEREFEVYELRMLIDAISSARFIGQEESNQLIKKIKGLASDKQAYRLSNQIHIDNRVVCEDKSLRLNIDKLHNAIQQRKAIKFRYGRYNLQKEFEERNPGKLYKVEPYGLVWNDGFYYLVGFNVKLEKIINYRVDRMRQLSVAEESFNKDYFNLAEHTNKCFNMSPGEVYHIKIKFDNHLINAIIDRFGRDVKIEIFNEEKFILSTKAALTEGLVRWILNWGSDAEVLYPNILVEKVKKEIEKMYEIYYRQ